MFALLATSVPNDIDFFLHTSRNQLQGIITMLRLTDTTWLRVVLDVLYTGLASLAAQLVYVTSNRPHSSDPHCDVHPPRQGKVP